MTNKSAKTTKYDYDLAPHLAKGRQLRSAALRDAYKAFTLRTKALFRAVAVAGARKAH